MFIRHHLGLGGSRENVSFRDAYVPRVGTRNLQGSIRSSLVHQSFESRIIDLSAREIVRHGPSPIHHHLSVDEANPGLDPIVSYPNSFPYPFHRPKSTLLSLLPLCLINRYRTLFIPLKVRSDRSAISLSPVNKNSPSAFSSERRQEAL